MNKTIFYFFYKTKLNRNHHKAMSTSRMSVMSILIAARGQKKPLTIWWFLCFVLLHYVYIVSVGHCPHWFYCASTFQRDTHTIDNMKHILIFEFFAISFNVNICSILIFQINCNYAPRVIESERFEFIVNWNSICQFGSVVAISKWKNLP